MTALLGAPGKLCEYSECRRPLIQRDDEWPFAFRKRRFCGKDCQPQTRRKPPMKAKRCSQCGATFERRERQPPNKFARQVFCSQRCARSNIGIKNVDAMRAALRKPVDIYALSGPHVPYDIDNPPPCFMDKGFFAEEGRIQASLRNLRGDLRAAHLGPLMDNVRDLWCLDCPLLQQCGDWAKADNHTGIAGGEFYVDGEKQ